jgi:hypothetical protein
LRRRLYCTHLPVERRQQQSPSRRGNATQISPGTLGQFIAALRGFEAYVIDFFWKQIFNEKCNRTQKENDMHNDAQREQIHGSSADGNNADVGSM